MDGIFVDQLQYPRAVFLLISRVEFRVVRFFVDEHFEHNVQEPLPQTPQSTGVVHALFSFFLIISLSPSTGPTETIGPKVNRLPKEFVAGPADLDLTDLPRLEAHGGSAGKALIV